MKYFNTKTNETYLTEEEMYDRAYEETDDMDLITDFIEENFTVCEIWDMLEDNKKCKILDLVTQNYIHNNIRKVQEG